MHCSTSEDRRGPLMKIDNNLCHIELALFAAGQTALDNDALIYLYFSIYLEAGK